MTHTVRSSWPLEGLWQGGSDYVAQVGPLAPAPPPVPAAATGLLGSAFGSSGDPSELFESEKDKIVEGHSPRGVHWPRGDGGDV